MIGVQQPIKQHSAVPWSLTVFRTCRYVFLGIAPVIFYFGGNVFWDAYHIGSLAQFTKPDVVWRLILPGFVTPQSLPSWLAYVLVGLLIILLASCVWAVESEAHEIIAGSRRTRPSQPAKIARSVVVNDYVWLLAVIGGLITVVVIRPPRTDWALLLSGALITIGTTLGLVVLALVTIGIMGIWAMRSSRDKTATLGQNGRTLSTAIQAFSDSFVKGTEVMASPANSTTDESAATTSPVTGMTYVDALIIVDVQNDFCPGGSLAVPRGDTIIRVLNEYIAEAVKKGIPIFASRDWHPEETTHFSSNSDHGVWPDHCVKRKWGALYQENLELPKTTYIVSKGIERTNDDGYSAFDGTLDVGKLYKLPRAKKPKRTKDDAQPVDSDGHVMPADDELTESNGALPDTNKTAVSGLRLADALRRCGVTRVYVGGLATDYCVKATVLSAIREKFEVVWLRDASLPVEANEGDGVKAEREMLTADATAITIAQFHPVPAQPPAGARR